MIVENRYFFRFGFQVCVGGVWFYCLNQLCFKLCFFVYCLFGVVKCIKDVYIFFVFMICYILSYILYVYESISFCIGQ